jgi:hypothetical protein
MKRKICLAIFLVFFCLFLISSVNVQNSNAVPNIKGNNSIKIISAKTEPDKVRPGDTMLVTAEIKDDYGIKSVTADMGGIETIELKLKEGNVYQGTWQNTWKVHSTEVKKYITTITATDILGNEAKAEVEWEDPLINFTTEQVGGVSLTPLDTNKFVVAWCDDVNLDVRFKIYNTDGTNTTANIDVDTDVSDCGWSGYGASVSVSAFNSTHFVVAWIDMTDSDVTFAVYDISGTLKAGPIDVDTDVGYPVHISVSTFNSTHFVIGWYDNVDYDVTFAVYDISGTLKAGPTDVDTDVGTNYFIFVSVSTFNSTHFVIGWHDNTDLDETFAVYDISGTLKAGPIDVDTNTGGTAPASVATLNSTYFVFFWNAYNSGTLRFTIYDSSGTLKAGPINVANPIGFSAPTSVSASALNSTHFVLTWYDDANTDHTFAVYDISGALKAGPTDSSTTALQYQAVSSNQTSTGISFCNQNFIHAFVISTSSANWTSYYPNGTVWDGICPDTTPPTYSLNSTNSTLAGTPVSHNLKWQDDTGLSYAIFSFDNCTGSLVNNTFVSMTGTGNWSNVTKTINSTVGCTIRWCVYANDTSNNWNGTSCLNPFSYITTSADSIPPLWQNPGTNDTDNSILQGQAINLTAQGKDETALDWAWLATNETGVWQNKTNYSSPMNMNNVANTWTWSNFTWSNSSVGGIGNVTVGWRIYYNDTSGNENATDIRTFEIVPLQIIITLESDSMNSLSQIVSRPNRNILCYGKASYNNGNDFANKPLTFTYDSTALATNNTDSSGSYSLTFSIPYEGNYSLRIRTNDTQGISGENSTVMLITTAPKNVKYRLIYRLGSSKTDDVYRIGNPDLNGTIDDITLTNAQYAKNLTHAYVCSYNGSADLLLSLVHSYKKSDLNFVKFSTVAAEANYTLELSQKTSSSLLLAYTKGTCDAIENKMYLVEKQTIPSNPFASFSFGIPKEYPFEIRVQYDKIQLNGSDRFGLGSHKVCIEKSGVSLANKPIVDVEKC